MVELKESSSKVKLVSKRGLKELHLVVAKPSRVSAIPMH